jgi:opacity protein-like surface antigen
MTTALVLIHRRLLLVALGFSVALTAWADDRDLGMEHPSDEPLTQTKRFGISPFYGYRFGGEVEDPTTGADYDFDDAPAYGLTLDYAPLGSDMRLELLWSHQDSAIDFGSDNELGLGEIDLTVDVIQFGGVVEFGRGRWSEYISVHLGATHFSSALGDDTRFSFGFGAGGKFFLTKNLYVRADVRGFCTVVEAEGSFIHANGITVASFSGSTLWQGQVSAGLGITF